MRPQVLVAIDWRDEGLDIGPVINMLTRDESLISATCANEPRTRRTRSGEETFHPLVHRITFDASRTRNTDVHGKGYRHGFLVHIEQPSESEEDA